MVLPKGWQTEVNEDLKFSTISFLSVFLSTQNFNTHGYAYLAKGNPAVDKKIQRQETSVGLQQSV